MMKEMAAKVRQDAEGPEESSAAIRSTALIYLHMSLEVVKPRLETLRTEASKRRF